VTMQGWVTRNRLREEQERAKIEQARKEGFDDGYIAGKTFAGMGIAAATAREKVIEELRRDKELLTVDLDKLIVQNAKLFDEVNDWRESAAKAMRENCGDEIRGDEHHCTCVGPLRHQLVRQAQRIVECEEEVVRRGRLNQLAISLAEEFERAVASRNPVGGMSVSPTGDFIACAQLPSAVNRMKWWAREIRKEQAELEEVGE